jgi:hypothetical protein
MGARSVLSMAFGDCHGRAVLTGRFVMEFLLYSSQGTEKQA